MAAKNSHRAVVKLLFENEADIEAKNEVKSIKCPIFMNIHYYTTFRQETLHYTWQQREDKHWWSNSYLTMALKLTLETKYSK